MFFLPAPAVQSGCVEGFCSLSLSIMLLGLYKVTPRSPKADASERGRCIPIVLIVTVACRTPYITFMDMLQNPPTCFRRDSVPDLGGHGPCRPLISLHNMATFIFSYHILPSIPFSFTHIPAPIFRRHLFVYHTRTLVYLWCTYKLGLLHMT